MGLFPFDYSSWFSWNFTNIWSSRPACGTAARLGGFDSLPPSVLACETVKARHQLARRPSFLHIGFMTSARYRGRVPAASHMLFQTVLLHGHRHAWAERALKCGYPERFAQQVLGHSSKAVHPASLAYDAPAEDSAIFAERPQGVVARFRTHRKPTKPCTSRPKQTSV